MVGSVVWVTGASSGIGEALVRELARRGARLVLSARRVSRLTEVRQSCERPDDHLALPLDLGDGGDFSAAVATVLERFGRIDCLVNNGGISQRGLAVETSMEVVRRLMEVDYFGTVALTRAVLPSMLERGAGSIVVVTSLVGRVGTPMRSAYAASKHALHGYFESLRAELHPSGVTITMVCPGFVRTEISLSALTADGTAQGTLDRAQAEGMAPERCARKMADAIAAERSEVLIGGTERFVVPLFRFAPWLYRMLIRRVRVT